MRELLDNLPDDLRLRAVTHPAFASARGESFERLEFLGDSVLGLAITEAIYRRHPDLSESELTRVRAVVVSRDSCAEVGRASGLGEAMVRVAEDRGAAYAATAERLAEQRNALAALVEGVIGAAFEAHGYSAVSPAIVAAFEDRIAYALDNRIDARSRLQELASQAGADVAWDEVGEEGPPHDRQFTVAVSLAGAGSAQVEAPHDAAQGGVLRASGTGRSKQEAQQAAAAALLALMDRDQG